MSNHLCNLFLRPRLIIQVVSNAIARFVTLVKTFYFPIDVLLVLLQIKVTKLDNTCLLGLILLFIVLFVKKCNRQCVGSAIDFRHRLSNYKSHVTKQKRTCRLVNHFIDNSSDHPLHCLKFILIEQVSNKTEKDLEEREGYWEAQLWTFEPFGFVAKKEFNSGMRRQFLN